MTTNAFDAWVELNQGGRFLERKAFDGLPLAEVEPWAFRDHLRSAATAFDEGEALGPLLDIVLQEGCGLHKGWLKTLDATHAEKLLDGVVAKPRRILVTGERPVLAVFTANVDRVGQHKGRRAVAHAVEYIRRRKMPLALVTNGEQWRVVHADTDNLCWVEWNSQQWLHAEELQPAFRILQRVLSPGALEMRGDACPLLLGIRDTRRGQARLSKELGERVRAAVELLLQGRKAELEAVWAQHDPRDVYEASCRFVMRLVVILFAEARELLPVDSPLYHRTYGLRGLLEALDRQPRERRLQQSSAWPRLLALFRLLHHGSQHTSLPVPTYGGELFRPGDASGDKVLRAIAALEQVTNAPSDEAIHQLLVKLTRTMETVREGAVARKVAVPVDFTELTSEYIGILYEGLLDYELKRAAEHPVVFLNLGAVPALPLDRLEEMEAAQLKALLQKAGKTGAAEEEEDGETEDADSEDADEEAEPAVEEEVEEQEPLDALGDDERAFRERAHAWACTAVVAAGLVKAARGKKKKDDDGAWERQRDEAARKLVHSVKVPGDLYLVRWGGTRKGSGTFYTRPQLTQPTVRRTLEPLMHNADGSVKTPEELLALKVCDPAMGSGSFLVAALRVLTGKVLESLHAHGRIQHVNSSLHINCALLPQGDQDVQEVQLEAMVRRAVVEHCIYGVDINPLAVELARVALWVETLDKQLPFTFLDHKLRPGNALVGAWMDQFRDYPLLAWWRQSPDEKHTGIHHDAEVWSDELKSFRQQHVDAQAQLLEGVMALPLSAVSDDEQLKKDLERVRAHYRELRAVPASRPDRRADIWRNKVAHDPALERVKMAFDTWCALWFWPLEKLADAPGPTALLSPNAAAREIVARVQEEKQFFHWELEFPDVFLAQRSGFDAVVANPPWETQKPNSREFFSNIDPLYRGYGKQEALKAQQALFAVDAANEAAWLSYQASYKDAGNFVRFAGRPFGDMEDEKGRPLVALIARKAKESKRLHEKWAGLRSSKKGLADPQHPFQNQGSADLNTYKLFLELSHAVLKKGGAFGLVVPSGIYNDKGSQDLRKLMLEKCVWRWLYAFENRQKIFDIDSRFKFGVLLVEKGGSTSRIRAAFMRHELEDWASGKGALEYPAERIRAFSPTSYALLEIRSERDLAVLGQMRTNGVLLRDLAGSPNPTLRYKREFHSTDDSKMIPGLDAWTSAGFVQDEFLEFRHPTQGVALPVLSGRIIDQFNFAASSWISGKGRASVWQPTSTTREGFRPEYLMDRGKYQASEKRFDGPRMALMEVASATNERTCIGALVPRWPGIHKTPFLAANSGARATAALAAVFNSFVFDYSARLSTGGLSLGWFVLESLVVPRRFADVAELWCHVLSLNCNHAAMAEYWLPYIEDFPAQRILWAQTPAERLRLRCVLDALVATLFGLSAEDLHWILRDSDHPVASLRDRRFASQLDPKGFWRVDKTLEPELRQTVLTLVAFHDIQQHVALAAGNREAGIASFCAQNGGNGWMLPETLRLRDLGLGHDERANSHQPVASVLGPRFMDWQLKMAPEQARADCERHARALKGDAPASPPTPPTRLEHAGAAAPAKRTSRQGNLF